MQFWLCGSELVFESFKRKWGFLTQTKAKIVSRKTLNNIALNNLDLILKHQVIQITQYLATL